jgi:hypothetical protein
MSVDIDIHGLSSVLTGLGDRIEKLEKQNEQKNEIKTETPFLPSFKELKQKQKEYYNKYFKEGSSELFNIIQEKLCNINIANLKNIKVNYAEIKFTNDSKTEMEMIMNLLIELKYEVDDDGEVICIIFNHN